MGIPVSGTLITRSMILSALLERKVKDAGI
jgi:hypothetical protein